MKHSTIDKIFATALLIIAAVAVVAVLTGHVYHIFTAVATAGLALVIWDEAKKEACNEAKNTID